MQKMSIFLFELFLDRYWILPQNDFYFSLEGLVTFCQYDRLGSSKADEDNQYGFPEPGSQENSILSTQNVIYRAQNITISGWFEAISKTW